MSTHQNREIEWAPTLKNIAWEMGELGTSMAAAGDVMIEQKPDGTPVTSIDKELNGLLIDLSQKALGAAVWSEEDSTAPYGDLRAIEGRSLVLGDPIDGTKKLVQGLEKGDMSDCRSTIMLAAFAPNQTMPEAAVVYAPFLPDQPMYWADRDGAYVDVDGLSKRLWVPSDGPTELDQVRTYKMSNWGDCAPSLAQVETMLPEARSERGGMRMIAVAEGAVDLTIFPGPESNLHDVIPPAFIAHKAGAAVRGLDGRRFDRLLDEQPIPGVIVAVNQRLAELSINYLNIATG